MLIRLVSEGRDATLLEREELAAWPGWGATPELFDDTDTRFTEQRAQLKSLWSEEEWAAARRTVLNAHYTNPTYTKAIWSAVTAAGFTTGVVLEPGSGSGNFIGTAPAGAQMVGIELDPTTASVSRLLFPEADIRTESFADTVLEGAGFDAVVGNVPFGQFTLFDKAYNPDKLSIHNHFIVKALRLTKPGGIVAVLSSRWSLDAENPKAREVMAKHGSLLGAVRLPAGAHGETAGTDVVTDLLIFRRNNEGVTDPNSHLWVPAPRTTLAGEQLHVNQYFLDHPADVIGELTARTGRFGPEVTVTAPTVGPTVAVRLGWAAEAIAKRAVEEGRGWAAADTVVSDRPVARVVQQHSQAIGHLSLNGGVIQAQGTDGPTTVKLPKAVQGELAALLRLRDAAVGLLDEEAGTSVDTDALAGLRRTLNREYDLYVDQFGPINRVTVTDTGKLDEDDDPIVRRAFPRAVRLLRDDPHSATVMALERFDEESGKARKAAIFSRRVVGAVTAVTAVDTAEEAIVVSLDRTGRIDPQLIGDLLHIPEETVAVRLGSLVFADPDAGGELVVAGQYLSGNVRAKLRAAVVIANEDPAYLGNVAALQAVIPVELGPSEIDVRPGALWVPVTDVQAWLADVLRKEVKACEFINGNWNFAIRGKVDDVIASKWGIQGDHKQLSAETFVKAVLNNDKMKLEYTVEIGPPKVMGVDAAGTEAMAEKSEALTEHFQDWLWAEPERATRLQTLYNDRFNALVLRSYASSVLTFPGKAATFTPRPHQHEAVARMVAEESVGLFHEVGAGKTAEMVMGVMELKRLGMVSKPAIVVPNNMLEQFTREFKQIYPRAQVLAAGSDDLAKKGVRDGRSLFVAKAATGDWDAVILTQGSFKRISMGEAGDDYVRAQVAAYRKTVEELEGSAITRGGIKDIEKQIITMEEGLKRNLDIPRDQGVTFEQSGIDYLCIDEAHGYKNLTVKSGIEDFGKAAGSQKATDLDMKLWFLREKLGRSRVATLATATPVANSLVEMYVMQKYLRPSMLEAAGVGTPDGWATQFTQQVTAMEQSSSQGFHLKTRTAKFRNVPELLTMWHAVGDVKTAKDLNLPTPRIAIRGDGTRTPNIVAVEPTQGQREGMKDIAARAEQVKAGLVDPRDDNMLKISSDGRSLALDPRLRGDVDTPEDSERTKLDIASSNIFARWQDNADRVFLDNLGEESETRGALQLVFADRGVPNLEKWNVYDALKESLIEKGMPAHLIKFIHDAGSDEEKATLFTKCRNGQVAVIIGSTDKMGTGTNIQDRTIALHHLDCPWRPADVTQREGRIVRQGNQNSEVEILRYVTEGSFDGYMWQTVTRKAKFIDQVMGGRLDVREVDDLSEEALSYAEITAIAAGDMRILEKVQLDADIQKVVRQERAFNREHTAVTNRIRDLNGTIGRFDEDISTARSQILDRFVATTGDTFTCEVRDMKHLAATLPRIHTERDDAGLAVQSLVTGQVRYVLDRIYGYHNEHPMPLSAVEVWMGSVRFDASVRFNPKNPRNPDVRLAVSALPSLAVEIPFTEFQSMPPGNLARRIEHRASSIPAKVQEWEAKRAELDGTRTELETMAERVWERAPHLEELRGRRDALVAEMLAVEPSPVDADQRGDIGAGTGPDHGSLGVIYGDPFAPTFTPQPTLGQDAGRMRLAP